MATLDRLLKTMTLQNATKKLGLSTHQRSSGRCQSWAQARWQHCPEIKQFRVHTTVALALMPARRSFKQKTKKCENCGIGTAEHCGVGTAEHCGVGTAEHCGSGTDEHCGVGTAEHCGVGLLNTVE